MAEVYPLVTQEYAPQIYDTPQRDKVSSVSRTGMHAHIWCFSGLRVLRARCRCCGTCFASNYGQFFVMHCQKVVQYQIVAVVYQLRDTGAGARWLMMCGALVPSSTSYALVKVFWRRISAMIIWPSMTGT